MPTYDDSLSGTIELLKKYAPPGRMILPSDHLQNDLNLDSLSLMELVADIEARFQVDIPTSMFDSIATVGDVAKAIVTVTRAA